MLMVSGAMLFFDADWPRKLIGRARRFVGRASASNTGVSQPARAGRWSAGAAAVVAAYCLVQAVVPLRTFLYPGDVLWHEQGMRYSWRVMVREKNGSIRYRVRWSGAKREVQVSPSRYLTSHQEREMSGQPDLILQLAQRIARDFEARGRDDVEVRADAIVSLNGRRAARMIDPDVDLASERDTLAVMRWITPSPPGDPLPAYPRQGSAPFHVAVHERVTR
jgi:hypothetical protein